MCLEPEFFDDAPRRKFMRDLIGVTPREAKEALELYHSTVWPVAVEIAEWLNENWSKRDIALRLGVDYLDLIETILNGGVDRNG